MQGFLDKIHHLEGCTPVSAQGTGAAGTMKRVELDALCGDAQSRLEKIERDDAPSLWEVRLGGAQRYWGFLIGPVFHFLWWDPNHEVCPTKKVRTN